MLATTVRLRTALVGAVEQGPASATPAIGVVCVRHVLLLLLMLLLLNVMSGLRRMLNYRRSRSCRVRSSRLDKKIIKNNFKYFPKTCLDLKSSRIKKGGGVILSIPCEYSSDGVEDVPFLRNLFHSQDTSEAASEAVHPIAPPRQ